MLFHWHGNLNSGPKISSVQQVLKKSIDIFSKNEHKKAVCNRQMFSPFVLVNMLRGKYLNMSS